MNLFNNNDKKLTNFIYFILIIKLIYNIYKKRSVLFFLIFGFLFH